MVVCGVGRPAQQRTRAQRTDSAPSEWSLGRWFGWGQPLATVGVKHPHAGSLGAHRDREDLDAKGTRVLGVGNELLWDPTLAAQFESHSVGAAGRNSRRPRCSGFQWCKLLAIQEEARRPGK